MIVCVHDANILIDLAKSGLLAVYAKMGWTTHVPDFVVREVRHDVEQWIRSGALLVRAFDGDELTGILELQVRHSRKLSIPDVSALFLARTLEVPLLTGDGVLRNAAREEGVACHGFLWILDKLEQAGEAPAFLAERLEVALAHGARLPTGECERRLTRWRGDV